MPAANLCMGWIVQLVYDSFAWRTHVRPLNLTNYTIDWDKRFILSL